MKQITSVLRIVALVLVGALTFSCTELNKIPGQAGSEDGAGIGNEVGTVTLTTTVGLEGSPATRALDATGQKTFSANDEIAIIYKNMSDQTVKVVHTIDAADISGNGKYAKITVTLDSPEPNGALRLIYPAAMAKTTIDAGAEINDDYTVNFAALNAQDGVLTTLAKNLDLTTFDGQFTSDGQLPALASLTNRLAILELTAKNYAGTENLDALTSLTVSDGTNNYVISLATLSWPVYVAVQPVGSDKTITVSAASSTYNYTKSVTGRALTQGNLYPVTVKMQRKVNLALITSNFEAQHGDILQGTLGSNVKISIADGAEVTLGGMAINGVDNTSCKWAGLTCIGNATIILADGTTNTVTGFDYHYQGIFIPAEKTLTIQGNTGSLTVAAQNDGYYHSSGAAAIGASTSIDAGNIEIQGGIIAANSGYCSAGIGGSENHSCGSITIKGGEITAKSNGKAAGIGGGENGTTGAITISGGKVKASGDSGGAGIGSGGDSNGTHNTNCGNILINGTAIVEAYSGHYAAAIGSGWLASCGSITISGSANVYAKSDATYGAAGIGSGIGTNYYNRTCGDIEISTSGTVEAIGGNDGAGIGCGGTMNAHVSAIGKCGAITIKSGTIIATGAPSSAGIGLASSAGVCGNITIESGITKVTATKGNNTSEGGRCIGYGNGGQANGASLGTISIASTMIDSGEPANGSGNYTRTLTHP